MKINTISLEKLHGWYDAELVFDPQITILAGINGSFKSTLLQLLSDLTLQHIPDVELERAAIKYDQNLRVYYYKRKQEENKGYKIVQQLTRWLSSQYLTKEEFSQQVKLYFIKTFDIPQKRAGEHSVLDEQLEYLLKDYAFYLEDLTKLRDQKLQEQGMITLDEVNEIEQDKLNLRQKINEFFQSTRKYLDPKRSELRFITHRGHLIPIERLSSGEKQLLIILLTVFLQRKQECVMLMDEPEMSLHIDWQYHLLDCLIEFNPNAQFILTTHSPSIFGNGWGDKVVYVEDVIKEIGDERQDTFEG